jgi:pimeloyl-ACP methyl ester carboxylesterase
MPHFFQFYRDFIDNEKRLTIKRAVSNLKIPYLIIHGNADTSVFLDEAKNLNTWQSNSELVTIDGADHVFGASHPWTKTKLPMHLEEVIQTTLAFLSK